MRRRDEPRWKVIDLPTERRVLLKLFSEPSWTGGKPVVPR
jgi:hypothetical protein